MNFTEAYCLIETASHIAKSTIYCPYLSCGIGILSNLSCIHTYWSPHISLHSDIYEYTLKIKQNNQYTACCNQGSEAICQCVGRGKSIPTTVTLQSLNTALSINVPDIAWQATLHQLKDLMSFIAPLMKILSLYINNKYS